MLHENILLPKIENNGKKSRKGRMKLGLRLVLNVSACRASGAFVRAAPHILF